MFSRIIFLFFLIIAVFAFSPDNTYVQAKVLQCSPGALTVRNNLQVGISTDPGDLTVSHDSFFNRDIRVSRNAYITGQIMISGGAPGAGKVLTSDASGLASWQSAGATSMPAGTNNQILRHNGTGWEASSILTNDGTNVMVQNQIKIQGGAPGAGKVLTSDADGLATWENSVSGSLPTGTNGQTLRYDGTNWVANSILFNNGSGVSIGTTDPFNYQLLVRDNGAGTVAILAVLDQIGNQLFVVKNTGNVGIGTDTPTAKLEVAGQIKITGGTPGVGKFLASDADGLASWQYFPKGKKHFLSNGTFTVPLGVTKVWVTMSGGGGGGGGSNLDSGSGARGGGGGGAGEGIIAKEATVTPGQNISVIAGAGGLGGYINSQTGADTLSTDGSDSIFSILTAKGGFRGKDGFDPSNSRSEGGFGYSSGTAGSSSNVNKGSRGGMGGTGMFGGGGVGGGLRTNDGRYGEKGSGYGSGGGGSGYTTSSGLFYGGGGDGAPGFVLIEW